MFHKYILKLYIIGSSSASEIALKNLKEILSKEPKNSIQLKVIDVRKHPQLAEDDKILAVPTLIKELPPPIRKIIGDLSDREKVLLGLNLIKQNK
jgi:circadian clock protein KaiB